MILRKKKKNGGKNAMLQPMEIDGLCCGDNKCALLRKYAVVIDLTTKTTAQSIVIDGTVYAFGCVIDLTSEKGLNQLEASIEDSLSEAGYTVDGLTYSKDGDLLTITTYWSQAVFGNINEDDTCAFNVVDAMVHGDTLNCDCCDAEAVCTIVPPTCYAADALATVDGALICVKSEGGKVLASWISETEGDATVFDAGGTATTALTEAGLNWTFENDKLVICDPACVLATVTQKVGDAEATELGVFEIHGDILVCFKIVSCKTASNVVINDGTDEVFNGPINGLDDCTVVEGVTITGNVVCLNATTLGYTADVTFTITISQEGCDDVVVTKEVNF